MLHSYFPSVDCFVTSLDLFRFVLPGSVLLVWTVLNVRFFLFSLRGRCNYTLYYPLYGSYNKSFDLLRSTSYDRYCFTSNVIDIKLSSPSHWPPLRYTTVTLSHHNMHAETINLMVINPNVKSATIKVNLLPILRYTFLILSILSPDLSCAALYNTPWATC